MMDSVTISYRTPGGGSMQKVYRANSPKVEAELERLHQRRVAAVAKRGGQEVGAVWKNEGRWTWYVEQAEGQ